MSVLNQKDCKEKQKIKNNDNRRNNCTETSWVYLSYSLCMGSISVLWQRPGYFLISNIIIIIIKFK